MVQSMGTRKVETSILKLNTLQNLQSFRKTYYSISTANVDLDPEAGVSC